MQKSATFNNESDRCRAHLKVYHESYSRPRIHFALRTSTVRRESRPDPADSPQEGRITRSQTRTARTAPPDTPVAVYNAASPVHGGEHGGTAGASEIDDGAEEGEDECGDNQEGNANSEDDGEVLGEGETIRNDLHGLIIRRNLTIRDQTTGATILQRLGPRNRRSHNEMLVDIKTGRTKLDDLASATRPKKATDSRISDDGTTNIGRFHLGVWYGTGCKFLTTTPDTHQDDDDAKQSLSLSFSIWVRNFIVTYVQPLLDAKGPQSTDSNLQGLAIDPFFGDRLKARVEAYDWLCAEVPLAQDLCHSLYNVCVPFTGFSGNAHHDVGDHAPSILLNFGHCRLFLPEYKLVVDLHPGEFVFLDTHVYHYTRPHPGYDGPNHDRWAVTCYFQHRVMLQRRSEAPYPKADIHRRLLEVKHMEEREKAEAEEARKEKAREKKRRTTQVAAVDNEA